MARALRLRRDRAVTRVNCFTRARPACGGGRDGSPDVNDRLHVDRHRGATWRGGILARTRRRLAVKEPRRRGHVRERAPPPARPCARQDRTPTSGSSGRGASHPRARCVLSARRRNPAVRAARHRPTRSTDRSSSGLPPSTAHGPARPHARIASSPSASAHPHPRATSRLRRGRTRGRKRSMHESAWGARRAQTLERERFDGDSDAETW